MLDGLGVEVLLLVGGHLSIYTADQSLQRVSRSSHHDLGREHIVRSQLQQGQLATLQTIHYFLFNVLRRLEDDLPWPRP